MYNAHYITLISVHRKPKHLETTPIIGPSGLQDIAARYVRFESIATQHRSSTTRLPLRGLRISVESWDGTAFERLPETEQSSLAAKKKTAQLAACQVPHQARKGVNELLVRASVFYIRGAMVGEYATDAVA
jgi:hypothetical protein